MTDTKTLDNKNTYEKVSECTIKGCDLDPEERMRLMKYIGASDDEILLFLYAPRFAGNAGWGLINQIPVYKGKDKDISEKAKLILDEKAEVLVGITNMRVFKTQNCETWMERFDEMTSADHIENGFFAWDKIECRMQDGRIETFGIYHKKACQFLVEKIIEIIHNNDDRPDTIDELIYSCNTKKVNLTQMLEKSNVEIEKLQKIIQEHQEKLTAELLFKDRLYGQLDDCEDELNKLNAELLKIETH